MREVGSYDYMREIGSLELVQGYRMQNRTYREGHRGWDQMIEQMNPNNTPQGK